MAKEPGLRRSGLMILLFVEHNGLDSQHGPTPFSLVLFIFIFEMDTLLSLHLVTFQTLPTNQTAQIHTTA